MWPMQSTKRTEKHMMITFVRTSLVWFSSFQSISVVLSVILVECHSFPVVGEMESCGFSIWISTLKISSGMVCMVCMCYDDDGKPAT